MSSFIKDIDQDDRLDRLEQKVKRLERKVNGGSKMSNLIKDLIGMDCIINGNGYYDTRCTVLDADDEWVKLIIHEKKKDLTKIVRIDTIEEITLD